MEITTLVREDFDDIMELFVTCFQNDHYYAQTFPNAATRAEEMRSSFSYTIRYCVENGIARGVKAEGALIAFILLFDYRAARANSADTFADIFGGKLVDGNYLLPYSDTLHDKIMKIGYQVLFLLSIAVRPDCRRRGIASKLLDWAVAFDADYSIVADVSNEDSLPMYEKRGFSVQQIDGGYYIVIRRALPAIDKVDFGGPLKVLLPGTALPEKLRLACKVLDKKVAVPGYRLDESFGQPCFVSDAENACTGVGVEMDYPALLQYQRFINVSHYEEDVSGDYLLYHLSAPYDGALLFNDTLDEMLPPRQREWGVVPDVYISIPMQYRDISLITSFEALYDVKCGALLRDLDFRTHYEAGVPTTQNDVDDQSGFKRRIRRFPLGKIKVRITSEITVDNYDEMGASIGQPALVDLLLSIDTQSGCAVLTCYSLSAPFLLSQLMDNVIRNQLLMHDGQSWVNLFEYLSARLGLLKRGSAKMFVIIPKERDCLDEKQIASLLASETIYPEGEELGGIIDDEILTILSSKYGMGQYDRASVYAYTNVLLQFCPGFQAPLKARLYEESITLFYIELILFEEAAIHIADSEIVSVFSMDEIPSPVAFLKRVDTIYDNYAKTIDFWDIQMNYPTSQKSVNMLRGAFRVQQQLEIMQRNRDQLQTAFDTKSDIVDREESKRMDMSLAILSVFAVFSAWLDGHDYIATWEGAFSSGFIFFLQRGMFVFVLVVAGYAIARLFSHRLQITRRLRNLRTRRKRKKK